MIGKLTPDDPVPNSDEVICENCECIVDYGNVRLIFKDGEYVKGCTECTDRCGWCGNWYFNEDMFCDPYLGYCCNACLSAEDYMEASRQAIEKDAFRCLFDTTKNKEIEKLIIKLARKKGYYELSDELNNDKS